VVPADHGAAGRAGPGGAARPGRRPGVHEAALDLREAVEELEWVHPGLPLRAVSVDLGDAPLDHVNACRTAVGGLLTAVLAEAGRLNRLPGELDTPQVLALARVSQLATSAHRRVAGRLP
jgi:hypothetical protein